MLKTSLILLTAIAVFAQSNNERVVFRGSTPLKSGILFNFRSVITGSDAPPSTWDSQGITPDGDVVHRFAYNRKDGTYFGYDARIEFGSNKGEYRVTLGPLTNMDSNLKPLPQPAFPAPQTLHEGDRMELDLLVSADGKVKLTDSFTLAASAPAPPPVGPQARTQVTCTRPNCTFTINFNDSESWLYSDVITGAPYSGQIQNDVLHTGPDGTHTSTPSSGPMIYRDSKGRMRSERHAYPAVPNGQPARPTDFVIAQIQDPVSGYQFILDPVLHVAHRMAFLPGFTSKWDPSTVTQKAGAASSGRGGQTTTFLGTQTISGVTAYGEKTLRTARSGPDGVMITHTDESWTAPNSGVELLYKNSSNASNTGAVTRSMQNYSEAEPDPALFQIPEGYKTADETGPFQVVHPNTGGGITGGRGPQLTSSCEDEACTITYDPGTGTVTPAVIEAPYSGTEVFISSRIKVPQPRGATYRDSQGRLRNDPVTISGPQSARRGPPSLVQIQDPIAGYLYIVDPSTQMAYRLKKEFHPYSLQPSSGLNQQPGMIALPPGTVTAPNGQIQALENLPSQIISGVTVLGQRTTITYPPGTFNQNDKTVVLTNERWVDPKTGIAILMKSTQPGVENATSIPDYKEGDPDPALFQIPADYKIIDESGKFAFTTPAVAAH